MATQRDGIYYVKRNFRGVGKITRSLRTRNKTRATALESALLNLHAQGRTDLIRAFADGAISIEELDEAYQSGRIDEINRRIREASASLTDAVRATLRDKEPDLRRSTYDRYVTGLAHFQTFAGDSTSVRRALTTESIQEFKAYRIDQGVKRETINNDLIAVSVLATFCLSKGWIEERPRIRKYKREDRLRYLERNEIIAYMAGLRPPFRPLFALLLGTGMRLGEAERLTVADLKLGNGETRALVRDAKTPSGIRAVFVPAWVTEMLTDTIRSQGLSGTDRLFGFARRTIQAEHKRACQIVGIPRYRLHDHRHTAAVRLARAGTPLQLIQSQLGHANISQTMQYAAFHPDYSDFGTYFDRMARDLGLDSGHKPGHTDQVAEKQGDVAGL